MPRTGRSHHGAGQRAVTPLTRGAPPGSARYGATVAVMLWKLAGVLKPAGVSSVIVVVPGFWGSNAVLTWLSPPLNTTGLTVITPTLVLELVTGTFAVSPPRSAWLATKPRVTGFSRAEAMTMFVLGEAVVVVMLLGLLMMNPEGFSVIVAVPAL